MTHDNVKYNYLDHIVAIRLRPEPGLPCSYLPTEGWKGYLGIVF